MFLADAILESYVEKLRRYALLVGAVLTIAGLTLTGMYLYSQHRKIEDLESQATSAQANHRAAEAWRAGNAALTIERKESANEAATVLEEHRVWADEPVPDDVADLLRERPRTEP